MATVQKSTIRRFNGVGWDPIYLATVADIVALGKAVTIEKMETSPFKYGDVLEIGDNIADLLINVVQRLTTLDVDVIPGLAGGSSITELEASKLTGTVSRDNLPEDVGGKGVEVADEAAKDALTAADVNVGDIVKVTGGKVYIVSGYRTEGEGDTATKTPVYMPLSDDAGEVTWSRITGTPTTLEGYGIIDAVGTADTVDHGTKKEDDADDFSAAGKVAKTNADGKLDFDILGDAGSVGGKKVADLGLKTDIDAINAIIGDNDTEGTLKNLIATLMSEMKNQDATWIKTGLLDLNVIPKVALSDIYVISNEAGLATLTKEQVQQGDTVKIADKTDDEGNITEAGKMFYVADETKLGTADWKEAFMPYTAAEASAVQWTGVLNKPTTLNGYGITDAVSSDLVSDTAAAGKLLKLNADGKLAADITGDAATLGGHNADYFAKAGDLTTVTNDLNTLKEAVLGAEGEGGEGTTLVDRVKAIENAIGTTETEGSILKDIADLKSGEAITALAASKLTGTVARGNLPVDIGGKLIKKADMAAVFDSLTADDANVGDLVKLDSGAVYMVVDTTKLGEAAGYEPIVDVAASSIAWSKITGTPTTLEGYGITDAVKSDLVITDGIPAEPAEGEEPVSLAGKLVALSADNKLHANIAGDAATVGGKKVADLTTKEEFNDLSLRVPIFVDSVDELTDPKVGQVVLLPVDSTTIVTNLDTGESERMDHMNARQNYTMTDTTTGESEAVDPSALRTENV